MKKLFILLLLLLFPLMAFPAIKTWDNDSTDGLWSTANNWSGDTVPATTDAIVFDATSTDDCDVDALGTWSGGNVTLDTTYGDLSTVTLSVAITIVDLTINEGRFDLNGQDLTVTGTFSNNDILWLDGDETVTLTMDTDSGTVIYWGTGSYPELVAGDEYYVLAFIAGGGDFTLDANLTVNGSMTLSFVSLDASTYDISIVGGLSMDDSTLDASDPSCDLDIGGSVIVGTGATLSAPAVADDTSFVVGGDWKILHIGIFTHNDGRVVLDGTGLQTMETSSSGADDFYDMTINGVGSTWSFKEGKTVNIVNALSINGSAGNLITLKSTSVIGTQWHINPQGAVSVSYVDVKDSYNDNLTYIEPANSVDSRNNRYWWPYYINLKGGINLNGVNLGL